MRSQPWTILAAIVAAATPWAACGNSNTGTGASTAGAGGSSLCWTYNVYDMLGRTVELDSPAQGSSCNGPAIATAAGSYFSSAPTGQVYAVTTSGYDGLQSTVTDPNGHAATRTDNAMAKTWTVTDPIGGNATYGYHAYEV